MAITPKEYNVILTKGLQSALENKQVEDGKLRFTTDTGNLYLDTTNGRVKISDIVQGYSEAQLAELIAPLPKIYLTSDTHRMYVFVGAAWVDLASIGLTLDSTSNSTKFIWFSSSDADNPNYDSSFAYNPHDKELSVNNVVTQTTRVGDMIISQTEDQESVTIDFNFASDNEEEESQTLPGDDNDEASSGNDVG